MTTTMNQVALCLSLMLLAACAGPLAEAKSSADHAHVSFKREIEPVASFVDEKTHAVVAEGRALLSSDEQSAR